MLAAGGKAAEGENMKKIIKKMDAKLTAVKIPDVVILDRNGETVEASYIISLNLLGEFMALPDTAPIGEDEKFDITKDLLVHKSQSAIALLFYDESNSLEIDLKEDVYCVPSGFWEAVYPDVTKRVIAIVGHALFDTTAWYFVGKKTHTLYRVREYGEGSVANLLAETDDKEIVMAFKDGLTLDSLYYEEYGEFPLSSISGTDYEQKALRTPEDILKRAARNSQIARYLGYFGLGSNDIRAAVERR